METALSVIAIVMIALGLFAVFKKKVPVVQPSADTEKDLLQQHVVFYKQLAPIEKERFENAVQHFLANIRITGIKTEVQDMDRVLVAAAAIIPIFAFPGWRYTHIHEVLVYPGSFDKSFRLTGEGRNTIGMVGNGALQDTMILSQQDLRNGFLNHSGKSNTAIHEFVHLVDKQDGDTDGLPEALLQHQYVLPWLQRMHAEIEKIKTGKSDINPYAATNEAEFFAVTAEYFFEKSDQMQEKHPELFAMLEQIFLPTKK